MNMSTIIKFELKELRNLSLDKNSCVIEKKVTQNLALQPWCLGNLNKSVKNLLDYKIGKYDKDCQGILLSYKNLKALQNVGTIRHDNADVQFQIQADYFIFQPYIGAVLRGVVNKKSITHLGVLVHRVFNVVIPRPTEEPGNKWLGTAINEGQEILFRVVVVDLFGALPYIRGELDERLLKFGDENDEVQVESKPNVSYVNFDKTKPNPSKQIGDGFFHSGDNNTVGNSTRINNPKSHLDNNISQNNQASKDKINGTEKNVNSEKIRCEKLKSRQTKANTSEDLKLRQTKRQRRET